MQTIMKSTCLYLDIMSGRYAGMKKQPRRRVGKEAVINSSFLNWRRRKHFDKSMFPILTN